MNFQSSFKSNVYIGTMVCFIFSVFLTNTSFGQTRVTLYSPLGGGDGEYIQNNRQVASNPFGLSFVVGSTPRLSILDNGNILLGRESNKTIYVGQEPDNNTDARSLTILAGNASSSGIPFQAKRGGSLILQAGNGFNSSIPYARGGDVVLRSGANHISGNGNGGDIILQTGGANNTFTERMRLIENGNVGIGTTTPALKLDVRGDGSKIGLANSAAWDHMYFFHDGSTSFFRAGGAETGLAFQVNGGGSTASYDGQTYTEAMRLLGNGNVGIGTTNPDKAKLQVKGSFHVENSVGNQVFHVSAGKQLVFVGDSAYIQYNATLANPTSPIQTNKFSLWVSKGIVSEDFAIASAKDWDDYVFNEDYQLPTLDYVAAFVKTNKHLPNIPSEAEVKKNGYSLIQLNRNFLKTIEELTLYAIDQENELKTLKEKTNQQALQIKDLQAKAAQYDHLAAEIELLKSLVNNLKK